MADRAPWRCFDCGGIVAPHVDVHFCGDIPDSGKLAKLPVRPQAPPMVGEKSPEPALVATGGTGSTSAVTWTYPPGTVVTPGVTYGGAGGAVTVIGGGIGGGSRPSTDGGGAGGSSAFTVHGGGGGGTGNAA